MGRIELITDYAPAIEILNDKNCRARSCEDGQAIEYNNAILTTMSKAGYLLGLYFKGQLKGVFWCAPFTFSSLQIHVNFRKQDRGYARGAGRKLIEWLKENASSHYRSFDAFIPAIFTDVIEYSKREGLEEIGIIKGVFMYNSTLNDFVHMKMRR